MLIADIAWKALSLPIVDRVGVLRASKNSLTIVDMIASISEPGWMLNSNFNVINGDNQRRVVVAHGAVSLIRYIGLTHES
jgi:hypothetical protein